MFKKLTLHGIPKIQKFSPKSMLTRHAWYICTFQSLSWSPTNTWPINDTSYTLEICGVTYFSPLRAGVLKVGHMAPLGATRKYWLQWGPPQSIGGHINLWDISFSIRIPKYEEKRREWMRANRQITGWIM